MQWRKELLIITTMLAVVRTVPFEVRQLDPQAGIVLETVGTGIVYEKTWTILTTIELPDWDPVLSYLSYCDKTLLEVCSLRGEASETRCKYWHGIILRDIQTIKEQISELRAYSNVARKRRGLVDVVGKVSKFLFGTMDHEDSEEIYRRIQDLENHDKENFNLISKQMTLIKSNFDTVLAPIKELRGEQNKLREVVNNFITEYTENIGKLEKEIRLMRVQAETSEIMLAVLTQMQDTQKILTHLFTLVNALQQHKLHPLLLRTSKLETLYQNITNHVSLNTKLKDPAVLNEIIRVDYLLLENRVLVKMSIPLGKETNFNIAKIYRYPVPTEKGHFALLSTKAEYVLTNKQTNNTLTLTKSNFKDTCQRLIIYSKEAIYLCKNKGPWPMATQIQANCITDIMKGHTARSPECPAQVLAYNPSLLVKMEASNKWLFSFTEEKLLQSHCENGTEQHLISGVGFLQISPKCSFTLGSWELPVETEEFTRIRSDETNNTIKPKLIFNMEPIMNITAHLETSKLEPNHQEDSLDTAIQQTAGLATQIHQIETQRLKEHQSRHLWTNLGISSTLTVILLLVILYLFIQARKRKSISSPESPIRSVMTISAPEIQPIQKFELQTEPRKKVNFKELDVSYEIPPSSPPPPPPTKASLVRTPSIRIPRHCVR